MKIHHDEIELILLPGKKPAPEVKEKYQQAYSCWRETWTDYQKEIKQDDLLHSDNFTRQDEILALFYRGDCAGLVFFREIDFQEESSLHDSYFKIWPEWALKKLCQQGKRILIISQFTVHEKFRKNYLDLSWKDLLVGLCYERFIRLDFHAAATAVRVQKHMDDAVYKVNGTPLFKNLPFHETQSVNLIGFFPNLITPSTVPEIAELAKLIFKHSLNSIECPVFKTKSEVKSAA